MLAAKIQKQLGQYFIPESTYKYFHKHFYNLDKNN